MVYLSFSHPAPKQKKIYKKNPTPLHLRHTSSPALAQALSPSIPSIHPSIHSSHPFASALTSNPPCTSKPSFLPIHTHPPMPCMPSRVSCILGHGKDLGSLIRHAVIPPCPMCSTQRRRGRGMHGAALLLSFSFASWHFFLFRHGRRAWDCHDALFIIKVAIIMSKSFPDLHHDITTSHHDKKRHSRKPWMVVCMSAVVSDETSKMSR
ncbi:hypothetical protein BS50DRAFT_221248 [Corynespora cassiicola Philippines]|uniref:Uncharacterized protein n=1 Tax=Corynespora cassiicola Philippines TaxID=1448308 RepID=A0A2T2N380_CORCC|nr:hypothetical protein BS50DRAFT_221248 [Corynespora cassiicola Philippines]